MKTGSAPRLPALGYPPREAIHGRTDTKPQRPPCANCATAREYVKRAREQEGYLKSLMFEQRAAMSELGLLVAIVLGSRRAEWIRQRRAMEPPYDYEAEADMLGAALRSATSLPPELFAGPTHRELATAISTGELAPLLLAPEMRGYRRGLKRRTTTPQRLTEAARELYELAARRRALEAAEQAVLQLRRSGGAPAAREELRKALDLLQVPA
jgi:hypothetical protein